MGITATERVDLDRKSPRWLVRGVNWLGDAIMTTPALLRLREAVPHAKVTLLTQEKLAGIWEHHPAVDEVMTFSAKEGVFSVARRLRAGKFQLALVLPNSPRSALECRLAGIPIRVGYARPWRNWMMTRAVPARSDAVAMHKRTAAEVQELIGMSAPLPGPAWPRLAHQVFEYLYLVSALGARPEPLAPLVNVLPGEVEAAREKFGLFRRDGAVPWVGLNPGAEYGPAKRWPVERFAAVAGELIQRARCGFVIFGGAGDVTLANELVRMIDGAAGQKHPRGTVINLSRRTSLRELCAALQCCQTLVTNDTGPMHLAAAVGTPVVVPYGSTSPELTGPGLPGNARHRLLRVNTPCAPCFLRECPIDFRCMTGIKPEQVVEAVLQVMNLDGRSHLPCHGSDT